MLEKKKKPALDYAYLFGVVESNNIRVVVTATAVLPTYSIINFRELIIN